MDSLISDEDRQFSERCSAFDLLDELRRRRQALAIKLADLERQLYNTKRQLYRLNNARIKTYHAQYFQRVTKPKRAAARRKLNNG